MSLLSRTSAETDEKLMRRLQRDDTVAFETLYDRHCGPAFRVAMSICSSPASAEEAVQDAFLSVWRSRKTYRQARGSFKAWMMRIVRNRAIDTFRKENATRHPPTRELNADQPEIPTPSIQDELIARHDDGALRSALAELPDAQVEVITLAYYGELSHSEIAAELHLPPGTVKGRMRLGLEKLRETVVSRA